jgi:hypothetical protein
MTDIDPVLDDLVEAEEAVEATEGRDVKVAPTYEVPERSADPDPRSHLDDVSEEDLVAPGEEEEAAVPVVSFGAILGVPLWYERIATPGPRQFPVAPSFRPILETTLKQVLERVPSSWGRLQRICTAGLYVGKAGMHGRGRACDWDRLVFERVEIAPREHDHASPSLAKRQRYWALAAIFRSNAEYVLHGHYDADHGDHIHFDNGGTLAFRRKSRAAVTLCQAILNDIFGQSPKLEIDGAFGPKTSAALQTALAKVQLTGTVDEVEVWRRFLRRAGRLGFMLAASP